MISIIVVMVLRVYAMWNQSKRILFVLLFIYVPQVIVSFLLVGIYYNSNTHLSGMSWPKFMSCCNLTLHLLPSTSLVTVIQITNFSLCNATFINTPLLTNMYISIPRFILGVTLLVLAVIQALKQLVEMHKATKQWQLNQCIQQLVTDGVLFFLVYVSLSCSS